MYIKISLFSRNQGVIGSLNGQVIFVNNIRDLPKLDYIRSKSFHPGPVTYAEWIKNDKYMATGGAGEVRLWSLDTYECVSILKCMYIFVSDFFLNSFSIHFNFYSTTATSAHQRKNNKNKNKIKFN